MTRCSVSFSVVADLTVTVQTKTRSVTMAPSKQLSFRVALSAGLVVAVAVYLSRIFGKEPLIFSNGSNVPPAPLPSFVTDEQKAMFQQTGVLFIPGLLQGDMLRDAMDAGEQVFRKPSLLSFLFRSAYAKLSIQEWQNIPGLARAAFESSMGSITADLLNETKSIRILKDAIFGQASAGLGCGYHVDDKGFWPANDDSTGINFWIALSDYNAETGGGIRVAPGSHVADWAAECRAAITGGFAKTCRMAELSPDCDAKLNQMSVVYDMKPGDAILWDRWIFHRQEPFQTVVDGSYKLRYTIRYIPSNARAEGMLHASVERGEPFNSPYHPQVWPAAIPLEVETIHKGLEAEFTLGKLVKIFKDVVVKKVSTVFSR